MREHVEDEEGGDGDERLLQRGPAVRLRGHVREGARAVGVGVSAGALGGVGEGVLRVEELRGEGLGEPDEVGAGVAEVAELGAGGDEADPHEERGDGDGCGDGDDGGLGQRFEGLPLRAAREEQHEVGVGARVVGPPRDDDAEGEHGGGGDGRVRGRLQELEKDGERREAQAEQTALLRGCEPELQRRQGEREDQGGGAEGPGGGRERGRRGAPVAAGEREAVREEREDDQLRPRDTRALGRSGSHWRDFRCL